MGDNSGYRRWKVEVLEPFLKSRGERKPRFLTGSGVVVAPLYTALPEGWEQAVGYPGEAPFTRGIYPNMYRGRLWTMRQYAGFGSAEESNRRYHYLLSQGQTGLSVAFDLPTQIGYDSDHPLAEGEVGRVGVAIDSLEDMEILFKGIPLDRVSTSMTINAPAAILLAMYLVLAEKQGVSWSQLRGTIQNDILKEYIARGTYIFPPEPSLKIITDIFAFCAEEVPLWNTISISGYHIREAGATAAQEVGFTLANGITYVEQAIKAGLDVDRFAPRLSFFFNSHNDLLEEVAKFRAARMLWARIMQQRFQAKNPRSLMLRFHTQTAGSTLTAQQPENNIVRVTIQALAAILGGTQSLHTNSMDEALSLPTEKAVKIALRTQQILAHESGVTNTVDPLGGSYFIENLTQNILNQAQRYIDIIDGMGGVIKALEKRYIQAEIEKAAYEYQKKVETEENLIVGVNCYLEPEEERIEILRVDPVVQERQISRLRKLREKRDNQAVRKALNTLKQSAEREENLMPFILEAVRCYATIGEICDTLREVYGEYREDF